MAVQSYGCLLQQDLQIALEKDKSSYMTEVEWKKINYLSCGTIRLSIENKSIL